MTSTPVAELPAEQLAPRATAARVLYLDGLRGLAALFVVTYHSASALLPAMTIGGTSPVHTPVDHFLRSAPILGLLFKGNSAVCIFFALSGVALSLGPLQKSNRVAALSAAIRRAPRLMIPALGATLLSAVLWASGAYHNAQVAHDTSNAWFTLFWRGDPTWWGPLREATGGVVTTHIPHLYVPVLWTMPWEFLGSMLVFGVLVIMPPRAVRFVLYAVGIVVFRHSYLVDFVAGMAICDVWLVRGTATRRGTQLVAAVVGLYGLVLLSCPTPTGNGITFYRWLFPNIGYDIAEQEHLVGAALVVAALMALPTAQRALSSRPCRFLGRVSFSLYLLHFLVLGSVGSAVFLLLHGHTPYAFAATVATAVIVAVSLAASYLFTVLIDEPGVRQLARLNRVITRSLSRAS
ncbi:MAG TPA: acyltransferase [Jatrophihabitans sp.]